MYLSVKTREDTCSVIHILNVAANCVAPKIASLNLSHRANTLTQFPSNYFVATN